jgi:hypothetical protein
MSESSNAEKQIVKCEYCKTEYTVEELFEEFELTCIPEHWYCSKFCYDNDWEGI